MKFILLSTILFLTIQGCFSFEKLFVNFVPYETSDCSDGGNINGIGYSGVVDTCLTIDENSNFKFEVSKNNIITWSTYEAKNTSTTCDDNLIKTTSAKSGSCVSSKLFNINQYHTPTNTFFYEISFSNTPFIAPNSVVDIYIAGETCEPENTLVLDYLTNGTFIQLPNGNTEMYVCINGSPFISNCQSNKNNCQTPNNAALECYNTNQFYNGSSFEPQCTSGSQQGSASCEPAPFSASSAGAGSGAVSSGSGFSGFSSPSMKTSGGTSGVDSTFNGGSASTGGGSNQDDYIYKLNSMNPGVEYYITTYCSNK